MGDRDRISWDDWDSVDGPRRDDGDGGHSDDGDDVSTSPTRRARLTLALVMTAALLATIVLCCIAAGEAGQLFWVELPPP